MMKKVLILGVAAVQLDAILHLKSKGYEVHAMAMAKDGKGADAADVFVPINFINESQVINYIKKEKIDVVYSVGSDLAMPISTNISKTLGMPYFVEPEVALICNNKDLMRSKLGQEFKGNVKYQILSKSDTPLILDYPFIMKPSDAQGQRGVILVKNSETFFEEFNNTKKYSRSGKVIIEQFISGQEISVNGYVIDGKLNFCVSSDRDVWPKYTGLIRSHIIPSSISTDDFERKISDLMQRACSKIGILNGPVYGQFKMEGNEPYIIEITPRLDGCHMWKLIYQSTGVNLLEITFDHLIEKKIDPVYLEYNKIVRPYVLEFTCQAPGEIADYKTNGFDSNTENNFKYYEDGQVILPVNGHYEKIAYVIKRV